MDHAFKAEQSAIDGQNPQQPPETFGQQAFAAGQRLLDVPEVTANTSLSYKQPLEDGMNLLARLTNSYVDSIQDITFTRNTLPAYDLVGFRGGVEMDRWSAVLFVDNLTNKMALLSDTGALSANISILNRIATNQPRTIGVDLNFKF